MTCTAPGWGTGLYGTSPWAGGLGATPGGTIPAVAPYDIYCVGPCGPMSVILTFEEVEEIGEPGQLLTDGFSQDLVLASGGALSTLDTHVTITTGVPAIFTHEYTIKLNTLPTNFVDVVHKHIGIGVFNSAGASASLFFSKAGIAYTGAFHFDGSGDLTLDSVFQPLPNSQTLISEGEYYTFRIAVDYNLQAVYVYATKTADLPLIGHQLKYILPTINWDQLATPTTEQTLITVRGSLGSPSSLSVDTMCLSSQFIVPNIPPVADGGLDQASRICAISQLDGSKSFDPEGTNITYSWRLIDAPVGSSFMYDGGIGHTNPLNTPTGFTNKFYSAELNDLDVIDTLVAGEVLAVGGEVYVVTGKGTDVGGFYITIEGFLLPDNIAGLPYKYLRQRGISNRTGVKPTFLPDEPGIYRFDLIVSDGYLFSEPSVVILNVTESPIPRGCIPDLRFLWDYLSDFWKLVEDKERVEVFWGSLAQVAASELLNLWQTEYSKSLRDVQRTAQRRWLHYDCLVKEPFPDLTSISGSRSLMLSDAIENITYSANGQELILYVLDNEEDATSVEVVPTTSFSVLGQNPMTVDQIAAQLQGTLKAVDPTVKVTVFRWTDDSFVRIAIESAFNFVVAEQSTLIGFSWNSIYGFSSNSNSDRGVPGAVIGSYIYRTGNPVGPADFVDRYLVLRGVGYKIRSIMSHPSDAEPFQRIVTSDPLPQDIAIPEWRIAGQITSTQLNFFDLLAFPGDEAVLEIIDNDTNIVLFKDVEVLGIYEKDPNLLLVDLDDVAHFLAYPEKYTINFYSLRRRSYIPIDDVVSDIPYLQEKIKSDSDEDVLRRNVDFLLEDGVRGRRAIHFATTRHPIDPVIQGDVWQDVDPPNRVWAEVTYIDNNPIIEQNFGYPAEFTLDDLAALPSNVDYLSAVRGLWYSYFKGPTLFNLRVGMQILLGLPFAEEAGTITEIRTDYSPKQGRILIQDTLNPEIIRSYTFPLPLELEENPATLEKYAVGDTVRQFAPLVTGAEVSDYVKDPNWFEGFLNQGLMFEVEKFFRFLTRVDSAAFNLSALLFVKSFILRIKPTYTFPYFVVLRTVNETEVNTTDLRSYDGYLQLHDGACTQQNGETMWGVATMFDEPDPSGGGWQSKFDTSSDPDAGEVIFGEPQETHWGFDKNLLCPEDSIVGTCTITFAVPTIPSFDSMFTFDRALFNGPADDIYFTENDLTLQSVGEMPLYDPVTLPANTTFNAIEITLDSIGNSGLIHSEYIIRILVNGVVFESYYFYPSDGHYVYIDVFAHTLTAGDVITCALSYSDDYQPAWETILVKLGRDQSWAFDTTVPAGTYSIYRDL